VVAVLAVAWHNGLVATVFEADTTHIVVLITTVFAGGLALCARRVWQTSIELNAVRSSFPKRGTRVATYLEQAASIDGQGRSNLAAALRLKLATRIAPVRHIANSLVLLGLIGTVIGFIIALSGIDPELAADIGAVGPMVSKLIEGMAVALYTTLTGAVLSIWLMVNYRLLESGVVNLLTAMVERVEANHGRA
jgi:biopolymer transport protein ExbB/TolQ